MKIYKTIWRYILVSVMMIIPINAHAEEPTDLYARSAVLMDADSGRVLFLKNSREQILKFCMDDLVPKDYLLRNIDRYSIL